MTIRVRNLKREAPARTPGEWAQIITTAIQDKDLQAAVGTVIWFDVFAPYLSQPAGELMPFVNRDMVNDPSSQEIIDALIKIGIPEKAATIRISNQYDGVQDEDAHGKKQGRKLSKWMR